MFEESVNSFFRVSNTVLQRRGRGTYNTYTTDLVVWGGLISWRPHPAARPWGPGWDTGSVDCHGWQWSWQTSLESTGQEGTPPGQERNENKMAARSTHMIEQYQRRWYSRMKQNLRAMHFLSKSMWIIPIYMFWAYFLILDMRIML